MKLKNGYMNMRGAKPMKWKSCFIRFSGCSSMPARAHTWYYLRICPMSAMMAKLYPLFSWWNYSNFSQKKNMVFQKNNNSLNLQVVSGLEPQPNIRKEVAELMLLCHQFGTCRRSSAFACPSNAKVPGGAGPKPARSRARAAALCFTRRA